MSTRQIDTRHLKQIFEDYGPALVLYARQWCVHPEDALQEAMIELAQQTGTPPDPVAWLYQAVRFRAINLSRGEMRRERTQRNAASESPGWFVSDPAAELQAGELQQALARLPDLEREIVIARNWGELSFEQIGQLVDRSSSAVHRRYQSALARLHTILEGQPDMSQCHE